MLHCSGIISSAYLLWRLTYFANRNLSPRYSTSERETKSLWIDIEKDDNFLELIIGYSDYSFTKSRSSMSKGGEKKGCTCYEVDIHRGAKSLYEISDKYDIYHAKCKHRTYTNNSGGRKTGSNNLQCKIYFSIQLSWLEHSTRVIRQALENEMQFANLKNPNDCKEKNRLNILANIKMKTLGLSNSYAWNTRQCSEKHVHTSVVLKILSAPIKETKLTHLTNPAFSMGKPLQMF